MAVLFKWTPAYNTGIPSIDAQHRKLVDILNELYDAMGKGHANQVLGNLLDELIKYTVIHFSTEERLFRQYDYPGFAVHKREHEGLTAQVKTLQRDYQAGKLSISIKVGTFLKDWLAHHILEADMKYAPFLISKGVK